MNRIHRYCEHLQRQWVAVAVLTVYLHIECRDGIHLLIKRCDGIVAAYHHLVVTYMHGVALALLHHLNAWNYLGLRLEGWHHHLGTLSGCSLEVQDGLLSDKHLQRIDALFHCLAESQTRTAHQSHCQYDILNFQHCCFTLNFEL